ncbi:MAG: phosphatase [Oscillospiraceae bacterium]|nr:phosphatase [Oscillospiraceae bacterium]
MEIFADMHTHTVASTHAYSTIMEMAKAAQERGLEFLACTDHTPASVDGPHLWHFHNLHKAIPRYLYGVGIIYGAEASVADYSGRLDFPDEECEKLDWIVGSVHTEILPSGTLEQNTAAYLGLATNPFVKVIGHPANAKFDFDYETAVKAFAANNKLVEVNENTLLWKNSEACYRKLLPVCRKHDVRLIVNTDAHFCGAVGKAERSLALLSELDYPKELIVNIRRGNGDTPLQRFLKDICSE